MTRFFFYVLLVYPLPNKGSYLSCIPAPPTGGEVTEHLSRDYRAVATGNIFISQTPAFRSVFQGSSPSFPGQKNVPPRILYRFRASTREPARVMSEEGLCVGVWEGTATKVEAGVGYCFRESDDTCPPWWKNPGSLLGNYIRPAIIDDHFNRRKFFGKITGSRYVYIRTVVTCLVN